MCSKVNGERSPVEVYNDFRSSVLQILSAYKAPVTVPNSVIVHSNNDDKRLENDTQRLTDGRVLIHLSTDIDSQPIKYPKVIFVVGKYNI